MKHTSMKTFNSVLCYSPLLLSAGRICQLYHSKIYDYDPKCLCFQYFVTIMYTVHSMPLDFILIKE